MRYEKKAKRAETLPGAESLYFAEMTASCLRLTLGRICVRHQQKARRSHRGLRMREKSRIGS